MDKFNLEVSPRDKSLKPKELLGMSLIPIEYYGKGVENKSFQVDYQDFRRTYRKAGMNTVIELNVSGKEKINVLIHDVNYHPVTDTITHVDLINVRMDQEIHTRIPLEFVGESKAVREMDGTLVTNITELEVKCLPKDLVHSIEVSVDSLEDFGISITVADVKVPANMHVLQDPTELVATVARPAVEEEPQEATAEEGAESAAKGDDAKSEGNEKSE